MIPQMNYGISKKAHWGVEILFLTWTLGGDQWSASRSGVSTPGK